MEKRHSLIKMSGGACLALFSLIAVSCAQDGFDDETWNSSVTNSTLASPNVEDIILTASADGKTQTLS